MNDESLRWIAQYIIGYDAHHGDYPEHRWEGRTVFRKMIKKMVLDEVITPIQGKTALHIVDTHVLYEDSEDTNEGSV